MDFDDKDLVIIVVGILCLSAFYKLDATSAAALVDKALIGLFAIVTGAKLRGD